MMQYDVIKKGKMNMRFTKHERIRYELFEQLLPVLLCNSEKEEMESTLNFMIYNGHEFVCDCYKQLCEDDGVDYPYSDNDFKVNYFEKGGLKYIQIILPFIIPSTGANNILRAYVLYSGDESDIKAYKYFIIKDFINDKKIAILNISSDERGLLGHDLTSHRGNMDYEYWKLAQDYITLVTRELEKK